MQCYQELTPPTAVTHSLSLPFISPGAINLVVAKTSLIQIFSLKTVSVEIDTTTNTDEEPGKDNSIVDRRIHDDDGFESSFLGVDTLLVKASRASHTKLVLVAEYALAGTITSMVRVQTPKSKSGGDSLLFGFRDAKLSLVEWDPERHGLSTVSIHYYEQEEIMESPWAPRLSECANYLVADPGSRCAALKFGSRSMAILPFRQGDEDAAMDDWDEELDGPRPVSATNLTNGDSQHEDTPYTSSFVLRMSSLDPSLIHPIHFAFLYEYREPTFGILSSVLYPSAALLHERKDKLSYMVFTLDLQQRASTTILVVNGLPYDLFQVLAMPAPVGGALLIGGNEIIHIDQAGKANGVAVNTFAKQCTSFGLADQSELEMRLEGCRIEQLSVQSGEVLFILSTGQFGILSFRMDGRSVSGLSVRRISSENGGHLILARPSCTSSLGSGIFFVGSEDSNSQIIGWTRKSKQSSRRRAQLELSTADIDDDIEEDDADDDLYGDGPALVVQEESLNGNAAFGEYVFRVHDSLLNIGPMRDVTMSKPTDVDSETQQSSDRITSDLELFASAGGEISGALVVLKREIEPAVIGRFEFQEARGLWTISAKKPIAKALQLDKSTTTEGSIGLDVPFDRLMIVSKTEENAEESAVYALTSAGFEALTGTEFEPAAGATIEAGTLGDGVRVIQVLRSEIRCYDGDLGLAQILPMFDDETGTEPKIVSANIVDPFLLLIRDDGSIFLARCDEDNELEEVEREDDSLLANKWLSGCLYSDTTGIFAKVQTDKGLKQEESVIMCLLSSEGALFIYSLPDLTSPAFIAQGISFVPPTISPDYAARRSTAKETLTEILLADLGDETSKSPYLILRSANDDLTIYEPFRINSSENLPLAKCLHFLKVHNPHLAKDPEMSAVETTNSEVDKRNIPMRAMSNVRGLSTVFLPGASPAFIAKSAKSMPKVVGLRGAGVKSMSAFHTAGCDKGFIYVDYEGIARVSQFPPDINFTEVGMVVQKIDMSEEVHAVAYHPPMDVYAIGTSIQEPFELPKDDENHREWQREDLAFKPLVQRSFVKLMNPINWTIIETIELDPYEIVMCIKTLNLEVSENTHEKKLLVTVGTALSKGEDLPIRGRIYVYEVVIVVPELGRPETNKRLKLISKEEVPRGAITGISEVGTQGFMLVAQGQKCMVRGLKEDGTLLPVAFMDMSTYVTAVKELPGSGLCVLADALKGVWLAGYSEEPYKMTLFGKQAHDMELVAADILPIGQELYIVVADSDCNLHILQFDPEHPKSLQGQLLLHRTTFSLGGHLPLTMTLLPSTKAASIPADADDDGIRNEILMTSNTGALSLLSPLSEAQYRRLSALSTHLSNTLYHAAGLNPRAYRISGQAPEPVIGGRPIVDGTVLMRWMELGSQRRAEVAGRVGVDVEQIREDLEGLRGGLAYL